VASASQVYASAITYFPNGAIKGFTYGNGITHTLTQNLRQLPGNSLDKYGTQKTLDDTYVYDANGNVDRITDGLAAGPNNRTRDLDYDGLDRLVSADAVNQWGAAKYAYDPLDNLRLADQGARQYRYNYDAVTNRLQNIKNPAGVLQFAFTHDASGNVLTKGSSSYAFDSSNRLNEVLGVQAYRYDGQGRRVQTTDADGKTTFWIYSQSGQVLHTSEARRSQNLSYIYLGNTQVATRAEAWGDGTVTIRYQHTDALAARWRRLIRCASSPSATVTHPTARPTTRASTAPVTPGT
jgi:YD repeat-containing protein